MTPAEQARAELEKLVPGASSALMGIPYSTQETARIVLLSPLVVETFAAMVEERDAARQSLVVHELAFKRNYKDMEVRNDAMFARTADFVDIVFDGPPGHEAGRFIWVQRSDGYWVLRIAAARQTWEAERAALLRRIAALEAALHK